MATVSGRPAALAGVEEKRSGLPSRTPNSNEWYTPTQYVEAARRVLGGIDLDPASCEVANATVKATRYLTKDDDGLAHCRAHLLADQPPREQQLAFFQHGALPLRVRVAGER